MRLAASNIAFAPRDRLAAYALLQARGVTGLEIAPGLFFDGAADPFLPTDAEAAEPLSEMRDAGLEFASMQSLLFGVQGAALFGDGDERGRLRSGMLRAIALAGRLAVPNLVFGSPRQRVVPDAMAAEAVEAIALDAFGEFGEAALAAGTRLGIEFNPVAYGTNFLNTADQAAAFVARLDHPAVTLILDVGAMHMNGHFDRIEALAAMAVGRISHVHVSEPDLAPAPRSAAEAARVLRAMAATGYRGWHSIEMKPVPGPGDGLGALAQALDRLVAASRIAQADRAPA